MYFYLSNNIINYNIIKLIIYLDNEKSLIRRYERARHIHKNEHENSRKRIIITFK